MKVNGVTSLSLFNVQEIESPACVNKRLIVCKLQTQQLVVARFPKTNQIVVELQRKFG